MKKSHEYDKLSAQECANPHCMTNIKKRFEGKHVLCYSCFQDKMRRTNNPCVSGREVRTGKVRGRKKGIYVDA